MSILFIRTDIRNPSILNGVLKLINYIAIVKALVKFIEDLSIIWVLGMPEGTYILNIYKNDDIYSLYN